jgi:predicted RNA-binding Zn-ribbon protein involved in translation (DUF1610 family)
MTEPTCPNCGESMVTPSMFHGGMNQSSHTHRECPGCGQLLIWFAEGKLAGKWMIDETEERRD